MGRPMNRRGIRASSVALYLCLVTSLVTFFVMIRWSVASVNGIAQKGGIANPVNAINAMPTAKDLEDDLGHKAFLYNKALNVIELHNNDIKSYVIDSSTLSIVVFYAPWCVHCQRYVSVYNKIADKYQGIDSVNFYAVNCVEYQDACNREKLKGYPTVMAFNVRGEGGSFVKEQQITSREADIIKFVDDHSKVSGSDSKFDSLSDSAASASLASYTDWLQATKNGAARECGASSRLQDALSSLDYFIAKDLLVKFDERKREAALSLLAVVAKILPDAAQREGYLAAHRWLSSHSVQEATKSWQTELTPLLDRRRGGGPITWLVCGKDRATTVAVLDSSKAFNCGVWMLLHFLTVAAEDTYTNSNNPSLKVTMVTASEVLALIHSFVADLFNCLECRNNFLAHYDACDFGRCSIMEHDYAKLQLWLFHMHNAATNRINNELARAVPSSYLDSHLAPEPHVETVWPASGSCTQCVKGGAAYEEKGSGYRDRTYRFLAFDERAVLRHLADAYRV